MPSTARSSDHQTVAEAHFNELFREADARLRAVRVGDAPSMAEAGKALALSADIDSDLLSSDQRLAANPHFAEMMEFVGAVEAGQRLADRPAPSSSSSSLSTSSSSSERAAPRGDSIAQGQFDTVFAASLKVMLREAMFAKDGVQRAAYVSRVHEWYEGQAEASTNRRGETRSAADPGLKIGLLDSRSNERSARAARYVQRGPNWKQPRPKSATTNVFLAGTNAGDEHATAMQAAAARGAERSAAPSDSRRPQSAAARGTRVGVSGTSAGAGVLMAAATTVPHRPQSATIRATGERVAITGRLNQGGFRVRNLFRSQRSRVQSTVLSRADKRRHLHEINKAERLHHADLNESRRSHQHLLRERPSASLSGRRAPQPRPTSAAPGLASSSSSASSYSASSRGPAVASSQAGNVYKYPRVGNTPVARATTSEAAASGSAGVAASSSLRLTRERDQWLEEQWLRGRSMDAADRRNQEEITAAMQQWAMNRGRIEEEIMRRQESRRYVARSGRFYAEVGSYQRVQSAAASVRPASAAAGGAGSGQNKVRAGADTQARPRTAKSAPRAKPIVTTPVVVMRKPGTNAVGAGGRAAGVAGKFKKPPMHFKYGPRTNAPASRRPPSVARDEDDMRVEEAGADARAELQPRAMTGDAKPPRARPASASASLSPYRGNYGRSVVSDSFGVRGTGVENATAAAGVAPVGSEDARRMAWDRDVEASDGEIAILSAVGLTERVAPRPAEGSTEAAEEARRKQIQEIAFGAAVRREVSLRPPPEKTTSKSKGGKKKKKKKKGSKKGAKKGKVDKGKAATLGQAEQHRQDESIYIPRPSEQPLPRRRPMSSPGRRTMREVESIQQAFTKRSMQLPCSKETLENALRVPEEMPYEDCVSSLPLPGAGFLSDPLAAERKALKALYMRGQKGGGGAKKKKKKKGGAGKKKKKKK